MSDQQRPGSEVHLIERVRQPDSVCSAIRELSPHGGTILDLSSGRVGAVSALDAETLPATEAFRWVRASDFERDLAERTRREFVRLVHEIGAAPIVDGNNIKELLAYGDSISLWWLSQTSEKHAINHPLRWWMYCAAVIDCLFEEGQVEEGLQWNVWAPDDITADFYRSVIGHRGRVVVRGPGRDRPPKPVEPIEVVRAHLYACYVVARALLMSAVKRMTGRTGGAHVRERGQARDDLGDAKRVMVVSISDTGWKEIVDPENHESNIDYYDSYMGYMPWTLSDHGFSVSWLRNTKAWGEFKAWRERCVARSGLRDASQHAVLGPRAALRVLRNASRFITTFNRLVAARPSDGRWSHGGRSLDHLVERDLKTLCEKRAVNLLVQFEQYRSAVEQVRPVVVLYKSEMFIPGRLISAAMKGRTRLLALQHGIHIDEALPYQFDPRDVDGREAPDHITYCPMPDVFAAFGEYAVEQFEEWGGFDADKVVPIGGVRHDHLVLTLYAPPEKQKELKRTLRSRLDLPAEAPVVLLCTQQRKDVGRWFDMVLQGIGALRPEVFVAVQLHHAHGGAEDVHAAAAARGFDNYRIFKDATYPLIACSDVVVTGPSTIVLESILLDTPAISIAGSQAHETYPYQRDGLATTISTPAELGAALGQILERGTSDPEWQDRRRALLRRHLWNDDAGACSRLIELIEAEETAGAWSSPVGLSRGKRELRIAPANKSKASDADILE